MFAILSVTSMLFDAGIGSTLATGCKVGLLFTCGCDALLITVAGPATKASMRQQFRALIRDKNQPTLNKFPFTPLLVMMAGFYQNSYGRNGAILLKIAQI